MQAGAALYGGACASCHGPAPGNDVKGAAADTDGFRRAVAEGKGTMPPVLLSEGEIERIRTYLSDQAVRP